MPRQSSLGDATGNAGVSTEDYRAPYPFTGE
jgi:hypothetical protein